MKGSSITKAILIKNRPGGLTLPDFKSDDKAIAIKTMLLV